jgi:hypothetical protein
MYANGPELWRFAGCNFSALGAREDAMGIVLTVDIMAVLVFGLLLISIVMPNRADARQSRR